MRSLAPALKRLAATFLCAAAVATLCAADPAPELPPSKRNAPKGQKLEFSQPTTATAPQLPKPITGASEALRDRRSMVPETSGSPDFSGVQGTGAPLGAPSKAFAERMRQQWDKKKNWLVPGAQDDFLGFGDNWASKGFEKNEDLDPNEKNKTVLERFLSADDKTKPIRLDGKRKNDKDETTDNPNSRADDLNDKNPDNRDLKDQPNGVSDFNLHGFLSANDRRNDANRKDSDGPKGFQPIRSEIGGEQYRSLRDRERERERDATRTAEFDQMIAPRTPGARTGGIPDPINSGPDLTRRDFNPILPRPVAEPAPESTPFNPAPIGGPRLQDRGMLGVAGPGMPSFGGSAPSAPPPTPVLNLRPGASIILEPPKRKFN